MHHYIASPVELPVGVRGVKQSIKKYSEVKENVQAKREEMKKQGIVSIEDIVDLSHLKDENWIVFDTQEDAAGISIYPIEPKEIEGHYSKAILGHFKNSFVYEVVAEWGKFRIDARFKNMDLDLYNAHLKCVHELFKVMRDFGTEGQKFELYTCWDGEWHEKRDTTLDRSIDLKSFEVGGFFELRDRQYIEVEI